MGRRNIICHGFVGQNWWLRNSSRLFASITVGKVNAIALRSALQREWAVESLLALLVCTDFRLKWSGFLISAEFATYLNFCRSLRFDDKPDYSYLRQLFRNLFHRQGFSYDYVFDWNMLKFVSSQWCWLSLKNEKSFTANTVVWESKRTWCLKSRCVKLPYTRKAVNRGALDQMLYTTSHSNPKAWLKSFCWI